jgi:Tfp pilus assembly protein PilX
MKPIAKSRPTPDSRAPTPVPRRGAVLVMAMVALLVVTLVAAAFVRSLIATHRQSHRYADELQSQWLAEAGLSRAAAKLQADATYKGEVWQPTVASPESTEPDTGQVTITVDPTTKKITVEAIYPQDEHRRVLARLESAP